MAARGNKEAIAELERSKDNWYGHSFERNDPDLVAAVEALGKEADGDFAKLVVVEIPDGIYWDVGGYDGMEWVAERHQTWG